MDLDTTLLVFYWSSDDNIFRVSILSSPITNFDRVLVLSASKLAVDEYQSEEKKEMVYITAWNFNCDLEINWTIIILLFLFYYFLIW